MKGDGFQNGGTLVVGQGMLLFLANLVVSTYCFYKHYDHHFANSLDRKHTDLHLIVFLSFSCMTRELTLYSITTMKYHVIENMENGAFALLEQMLHFQ